MIRDFARLYRALDETNRTADKVSAMADYFRDVDPAEGAWAVWLLSGQKLKRLVSYQRLREWGQLDSGLPEWLFEESYQMVGDLAETLSLVVPSPATGTDGRLSEWVSDKLKPLAGLSPSETLAGLRAGWSEVGPDERLVVLKMLTGGLRVGVSQKLVVRAIGQAYGLPVELVAHRMMGRPEPTAEFFRLLIAAESSDAEAFQPYPFCLAHPLEDAPESLGPIDGHLVEWKWDGIRCQWIKRAGEVFLWSRGEERLEERFPEVVVGVEAWPDGVVMDGELLAWRDDRPLPFQQLQRRIQRKTVGRKLLAEVPVVMLAFDLLELDGIDFRPQPLRERRAKLAELIRRYDAAMGPATGAATQAGKLINGGAGSIRLSPAVEANGWRELGELRTSSRAQGAEGFMLKPLDLPYRVGRTRGTWWKWKVEPYTIDAVLIYAQRGHGRRASLYTDYTFALWDGPDLVPIAKAYSGLTDAEIRRVDRFVREHTREQFGPVRSVTPELVMELAFENIQPSSRHKSGIAVRFPRIVRIRADKRPEQANTLDELRQLARVEESPRS